MDKEELTAILENHKKWIMGNGGEKANLSNANLRWANLSVADLSGADLRGADLIGAYLSGANLSRAYLRGANLSVADLSGANLSGANLSGADLRGANLSVADLSGANLSEADLSGANLSEADLSGAKLRLADLSGANLSEADLSGAKLRLADLRGAYLSGAYLSWANLRGANLSEAKGMYYPLRCPDTGSFIGWKKAGRKIVKLLITNDAKRSSSTGNKCRCSKAVVLEIQSIDGKETFRSVKSDSDESFLYEVGKTVEVDNFDENRWEECAPGIHFFITREEAVNYV